jgi:streptomycin 6-kinase
VPSTTEAAALIPDGWREWVSRLPPEGGPSGAEWAAGLPRLLAGALDDWDLTPTGHGMTGWTAVVVPVRRDGEAFVLKVAWPHRDAQHEHLALRLWDGRGAVRLVAADTARGALLLEALDPARDLEAAGGVDSDTACATIGGILARLHVPAPPQVRRLSDFAAAQGERLQLARDRLPRRFLDRAAHLAADLVTDPDCDGRLLHTDLHFGNVLAGGREPWLAIDPSPMAGHPGLELQPVLRNRVGELGTGSAFRWGVRRRLEVTCEAAGIDVAAARAWTIWYSVVEANWASLDGDTDAVTLHLSIAKALED